MNSLPVPAPLLDAYTVPPVCFHKPADQPSDRWPRLALQFDWRLARPGRETSRRLLDSMFAGNPRFPNRERGQTRF